MFFIHVIGIEELKTVLNQPIDNVQIQSLCSYSSTDNHFTYPSFECLSALSPVLPYFSFLIKNKVFSHIWKNSIATAQAEGTEISVSTICEIVWPSMLHKIDWLKIELSQQTLQLSVVDEYFSDLRCESDITEALKDIWALHDKYMYADIREATTFPVDSIKAISNYWFLRECQQAAEAILTLRQKLSHVGDFSKYIELVHIVSLMS